MQIVAQRHWVERGGCQDQSGHGESPSLPFGGARDAAKKPESSVFCWPSSLRRRWLLVRQLPGGPQLGAATIGTKARRLQRFDPLGIGQSAWNVVNQCLAEKGHNVCPTVVGDLLRGLDYRLPANRLCSFITINRRGKPLRLSQDCSAHRHDHDRYRPQSPAEGSTFPMVNWPPSTCHATPSAVTGTTRSRQIEEDEPPESQSI